MPVLFPSAQKIWRESRPRKTWKAIQKRKNEAINGLCKVWQERHIRYDVTVFMNFKNAACYLAEFIEFHTMVGVEHFFLYDNHSSDDCQTVLQPYIRAGIVTLVPWPQEPSFPSSRLHCVENFGHLARWIAFLDDDEFLFPTQGGLLGDVLRQYEEYPAVAVHWVMFGSDGHQERPTGLVISNYQRSEGSVNPHIKSIVNPRRIKGMASPPSTHYWIYKEHFFKKQTRAVNERRQEIPATLSPVEPCANVLRINHYWSKSYEDGLAKMARGWQDSWSNENTPRIIDHWLKMDAVLNRELDTVILRYEEELKARIAQRPSRR